ncbi:hypothetical protein LY78DRAFT_304540 [Colletotrichum sublineola]|nr:hypothetical protein LY78DRAFT_304540 [Colletotrichum sublineola]
MSRLLQLWRTGLFTNLPIWEPAACSVWSRERQPVLPNFQDSNLSGLGDEHLGLRTASIQYAKPQCLTPDE